MLETQINLNIFTFQTLYIKVLYETKGGGRQWNNLHDIFHRATFI